VTLAKALGLRRRRHGHGPWPGRMIASMTASHSTCGMCEHWCQWPTAVVVVSQRRRVREERPQQVRQIPHLFLQREKALFSNDHNNGRYRNESFAPVSSSCIIMSWTTGTSPGHTNCGRPSADKNWSIGDIVDRRARTRMIGRGCPIDRNRNTECWN
jgi:hypothetical protein